MNDMPDLKEEKAVLRRLWRKRRDALSAEARALADARIANELVRSSAWEAARKLFAYAAFGSEVETDAIVEQAFDRGMAVAAPRTFRGDAAAGGAGGLCTEWHVVPTFEAWRALPASSFGIKEPDPARCEPCPLRDRSLADALALVPGFVFDREGFRLGYGGGCYDRFLPAFKQAGGVALGLARADQLSDGPLPREPFDVPVDGICTERGVRWCGAPDHLEEETAL